MGKRVSFKRVMSAALAVVMAASLCIMAVPAYNAEAAAKKKTVTMTKEGGDKDIDMARGAKIQLKVRKDGATVGKRSVTYKVHGKSVISCSKSGLITAKKAGDAEITIKDKYSDYSATVYVEVAGGKSKDKKKPDKIWLDRASITLNIGDGYHASVFERPKGVGGHVTWTSENSDIATVDQNGYIRAVGHGSVRIHANKRGRDAAMMVNVN